MTTIFIAIFIVLLLLISKLKYDSTKHYNWFINLKPGDKIFVQIFSANCECLKEAVVVNSASGNFLDAKIIDLDKCKICANLNSKLSENDDITCWYNITRFHKNNVVKI